MLPKKLQKKLATRKANSSLRALGTRDNLIDFSSNDYLGFSRSSSIFQAASVLLERHSLCHNGATGSRLLSGNHALFQLAEQKIAHFHRVERALIFTSGYDANLGFFSSVPQRGDIILYDELCHASIRDGIKMSNAKAYKFRHNNLKNLKDICNRLKCEGEVYIVTESVFSMDGDQPDLAAIAAYVKSIGGYLIVDEAHALGVIGTQGAGMVQALGLEKEVFARLVTFGKGLGCHGAAILGSVALCEYLFNFARSFIYTTALPPHNIATICSAYTALSETRALDILHKNIACMQDEICKNHLEEHFVESNSAIFSCLIPGNERVKNSAALLKKDGFEVKPILSPTVPKGQERLRICIHSFNTEITIQTLVIKLASHLK